MSQTEQLYLGVDGGQSRTRALIGDRRGKVLGRGEAGPCNHVGAAQGRERLRAAVSEATEAALRQAGLAAGKGHYAAACFGMSGGPADKQALLAELLACERLAVTTDADIALLGGAAGQPGVVVIAGTGSMAFGRNGGGQCARAGGWGYLFGDEGGAFDLVRQALRGALRYEEGWGPATRLRQELLDAFAAQDANELMHRFYTEQFARPQIASFAEQIDRAAAAGDEVAAGILEAGARGLADLAGAVRNRLFRPAESAHIVYTGGVFRSAAVLADFERLLHRQHGNQVMAARFEPVWGALLGAYRLAGLDITPERAAG